MIQKRLLLWDWTNTRDCPSSLALINTTGPISSLTNWNTWTPTELQDLPLLPFQPMIRTLSQLEGEDWNNVLAFTSSPTNKNCVIHYLNEPDRQGTTPKEAVKGWMEKIAGLRKERGVTVVGPACASDKRGEEWMGKFLRLLRGDGEEVDFLGVHYYGEDAEGAVRYLDGVHGRFPEMRVVVSEIGCTSREDGVVSGFMGRLCNWMDAQDWIVEYGFFGCMRHVADDFVSPAAQLMNPDGTLTELMGKYMNEQPMIV